MAISSVNLVMLFDLYQILKMIIILYDSVFAIFVKVILNILIPVL
jgi:hypothetical protein